MAGRDETIEAPALVRRGRQPRIDRRDEIVKATIELVRHRGPDVSMDEIAAAVGVSKPILYRNIGDRTELVAAVADIYQGIVDEAVQRVLTRDGSVREIVRAAIDAFLRFLEEDPDIYRFVVRHAVSAGPEGRDVADEFMRHTSRDIAEAICSTPLGACLDPGRVEECTLVIVGMVHSAGRLWLAAGDLDRPAAVERLTTLVLEGSVRMIEEVEGPVAAARWIDRAGFG